MKKDLDEISSKHKNHKKKKENIFPALEYFQDSESEVLDSFMRSVSPMMRNTGKQLLKKCKTLAAH